MAHHLHMGLNKGPITKQTNFGPASAWPDMAHENFLQEGLIPILMQKKPKVVKRKSF